jgi:hypothetical protein
VVATPPVPGFAEIPAWTSDDVLELDFVPPRVIVLGGGVVACELAQFLRRIGSEVVQIQRSPHLLTDSPPEAAEVIAETFRAEGIELFTDTRMTGVAHADGGFRVDFIHAGETKSVHAPHLLNGLGRRPAIDGLGLEVAGIETRPGGHGQKFANCTTIQCLTAKHSTEYAGDGPGRAGSKDYGEKMGVTKEVKFKFKCIKNGTAPTTGMKGSTEMIVVAQDEKGTIYQVGDFKDYKLLYEYGRKTGAITRPEGEKRGWSVTGWPIVYHNKGDLVVDLHRRWYFKLYLQRIVLHEMFENWMEIKKNEGW